MNIQILKIYQESFANVRSHKQEWMKVACGPFLILVLGVLVLASFYLTNAFPFGIDEAGQFTLTGEISSMFIFTHIVFVVALLISVINLQINGLRYAVLRDGGDRWITLNLNMRFVKLILYGILYNLLSQIYGFIAGLIIGFSNSMFENDIPGVILAILFGVYGFYLLFRISLYTVAISIDQRAAFRTSWKLLKGNVWRFVGLFCLITLTIMLMWLIGSLVLGLLTVLLAFGGAVLALSSLFLWVPFGLLMTFIGWALTSKMLGLVYQELSKK